MNGTLRASDIPVGSEGIAYMEVKGNIENVFFAKSIEANVELDQTEIKVLGRRDKQSKTTGMAYSGKMKIYGMTTVFKKMILEYKKTGYLQDFKLVTTKEDKSTTIGKETIVLMGCQLKNVALITLDVDAEVSEEELEFTFSDFDILDEYTKPQ